MLLFIGKEGSHKFLNESTNGLVIVRCGNPPPLSQFTENCFKFDHDPPYCADGSQRPLNTGQKPVEFYEKLFQLFTMKGDWVLDGLSGTGMCTLIWHAVQCYTCMHVADSHYL